MLLCLGGSQASVIFAMVDMCYAWIQNECTRKLHFASCIREL